MFHTARETSTNQHDDISSRILAFIMDMTEKKKFSNVAVEINRKTSYLMVSFANLSSVMNYE